MAETGLVGRKNVIRFQREEWIKCVRMMRSKSFKTQEVREVGRKEAGESRDSHFFDGNNEKCLQDGRKGMQKPGKIENMWEKIFARARKVL